MASGIGRMHPGRWVKIATQRVPEDGCHADPGKDGVTISMPSTETGQI